MELVWQEAGTGAQRDVRVRLGHRATLGEVVAEITGAPAPATVFVDDRAVEAAAPALRHLRIGSVVAADRRPQTPTDGGVVELRVVGGLHAGGRVDLAVGVHRVGRGDGSVIALDSPTVSTCHAELTVEPDRSVSVTDLGSTNGVRIDGVFAVGPTPVEAGEVLTLGAARLTVGPLAGGEDRVAPSGPTRHGRVSFNRPPRSVPAPPPPPVRAPAAPADPAPRSRFGWAALVTPLILGAAMALLYDPRFAMFALFSPAMMLGNLIEDRRRLRRETRRNRDETGAALATLKAELAATAAAELARRRALLCDPAEVLRRVEGPSSRLWERRRTAPDFLSLTVGAGPVAWEPPLTDAGRERAEGVDEVVVEASTLPDAPVPVDLGDGGVLGVVGPADVVAALLRSLVVQAAATAGPADLRIAVVTDDPLAWDWAKWLPHATTTGGARLLAADAQSLAEVLAEVGGNETGSTLVVADAPGVTEGRDAPLRTLLASRADVSGIVVAPAVDRLPSVCDTVLVAADADGTATCTRMATAASTDGLLLAGLAPAAARTAARRLAGLEDPEAADTDAGLPDRVALADLVGEVAADDVLRRRWDGADACRSLRAPVGVGTGGPLVLDLVADGPHTLVAGTTGAGKSELLRSLVAGLAASYGPDDVTFVLVDYKGGSAFDACADLPHTVGLVTDLDEELGARALRCLEAELRHRERMLRSVGAADLAAYADSGATEPLPRLLVVVDEFAALVAELPDFVDRLVGIAQRGRSLGVHLVLATQRPAGAVNDHIRANTNIRVALRVQDAADSSDVIGSDRAARLHRRHPGRGFVRLGPAETVGFQAALVSAPAADPDERVTVSPFVFGPSPAPAPPRTTDGETPLHDLVTAARKAFDAGGAAPVRRPWPEPLPGHIPLDDLAALPDADADRDAGAGSAPSAVLGLADDPDRQRQVPYRFDAARGNLLLYGVPGSGTTGALASLAIALADARTPTHCYVLDFGNQALAPLAGLPFVGAVIGAAERERQERLVRHLSDELDRRRRHQAAGGDLEAEPWIVVLVDNYAGFAAAFDDMAGMRVLDAFTRIVADGPGLRVCAVVSADRPGAIPMSTAALVPERLLFRLADRHDYATFGVRGVGDLPTGRAIDAASGLVVQMGDAGDLSVAVPRAAAAGRALDAPAPIGALPLVVARARVESAGRVDSGEWHLPLGIGDGALAPAGLRLGPAEHALIGGPARSGRSTTLATLAAVARAGIPGVVITAVCPRRSPLAEEPCVDRVVADVADLADLADLAEVTDDPRPQLFLVEDADEVDDPDGAVARLLDLRRPDLHVVAAGRTDAMRTAYGHWTGLLRRNRRGVALRPNVDMDGDLWQSPLPRGVSRFEPGRGYLLSDGECELVQVATV